MEKKFFGIYPAALVPFDEEERVDFNVWERYIDFLIAKGVNGLFLLGTNGEGPLLNMEEKKELLRVAVNVCEKRIPVIVQVGEITTDKAVELAQFSAQIGVDAVAALPHYYFKLNDASILEAFEEIARAVEPLPFFVYNIPGYTGNPVKDSILTKLKEKTSNLIGIKNSEQDLAKLMGYKLKFGDDFVVMTGTDSLVAPSVLMGADGAVSAIADVFPEFCSKLYEEASKGNVENARKMQFKLLKIRELTKSFSDSRAVLKYIAQKRGIFKNSIVRKPLKGLSDEEMKIIDGKIEISEDGELKIKQ
ncbi:MAG: hypothetical protein PWQ48_710 [Thermotogaceae bacterium]|jgi:4-hydroxy-tetrahydrodipicolinate synthase|nr:hypothetical protein [Thermotogaceae bacterium]